MDGKACSNSWNLLDWKRAGLDPNKMPFYGWLLKWCYLKNTKCILGGILLLCWISLVFAGFHLFGFFQKLIMDPRSTQLIELILVKKMHHMEATLQFPTGFIVLIGNWGSHSGFLFCSLIKSFSIMMFGLSTQHFFTQPPTFFSIFKANTAKWFAN